MRVSCLFVSLYTPQTLYPLAPKAPILNPMQILQTLPKPAEVDVTLVWPCSLKKDSVWFLLFVKMPGMDLKELQACAQVFVAP